MKNSVKKFLRLSSIPGIMLLLLLFVLLFTSGKNQKSDVADAKTIYSIAHQTRAVKVPDTLDFCGENVPLQDFDVYERIDRELLVNTYWQSQTLLMIKEFNQTFKRIEPVLKANGVPDDFIFLAVAESGLRNVTSPSNAVGVWQFLAPTAKLYGLEINSEVDERYDIEKSTLAACKYLKEAEKQFGSWTLAAAGYNMGNGGVANVLKVQKATNYYDLFLNIETSRYVFRILALKEIIRHPQRYGFMLTKKDLYPPLQFKTISVSTAIPDLAAFAQQNGISYKLLKIFNPWLLTNSLTNAYHKTYEIKIPTGKGIEEEYTAVVDTAQ